MRQKKSQINNDSRCDNVDAGADAEDNDDDDDNGVNETAVLLELKEGEQLEEKTHGRPGYKTHSLVWKSRFAQ